MVGPLGMCLGAGVVYHYSDASARDDSRADLSPELGQVLLKVAHVSETLHRYWKPQCQTVGLASRTGDLAMQSLQSTMMPLSPVLACTAREPQTGQLNTVADFGAPCLGKARK